MLDEYLAMLEEAKKRDHRKIGKEMELFMFSERVGKGLPIWFFTCKSKRGTYCRSWNKNKERITHEEITNFKFEAYINDTPIKETIIREPGKYGLVRFIREVFLAIKNRRAPVVVAKMNGNNLSVNPIAPVAKTTTANITPRGYALGVIAEFRKLGLKCNEFVSLYDYSKGKLNTTVSKILNKHIKVSNGEIAEIEGIKKLSDVIPRLNSDKRLQDEMKKILSNYNNYVTMYSRYLLNIAQTKFKD